MDERTKNWHAAMERAVERFQEERSQWPDQPTEPDGVDAAEPIEVREVDERVLEDLASKYNDVKCPVHGTAPRFELEGGAVREWFCCEVLLGLVRELSSRDAA